jgi:hypothetical protein
VLSWSLGVLVLSSSLHLAAAVKALLRSSEFLQAIVVALLSLLPPYFSWVNHRDSVLSARDAAAAEERKANAAKLAERDAAAEAKLAARDAAAAEERKANAAKLAERDAAAAEERKAIAEARRAEMDSFRALVLDASKIHTHQVRSVAASLTRVHGGGAASPAFSWSAAEVSAWLAASARWKQYERHFAAHDGEALFTITREEQLAALGVLPSHTAALLADLQALV